MSLRIVFMGTPEFSVPSLETLIDHGYDIVGVITATDKFGGRGRKKRIESAVKKYAIQKGLRVLQPKNLKHPDFVAELRTLNADLQVVVAFRMLPVVVWDMPPMGTLNLHGSLLPKYRGAAPINWAIIKGEEITGVTTFLLKHEIDTGDMLITKEMSIHPDDTAGDVHDRMMHLGAEAVLESVRQLEAGTIQPVPQDHLLATKAPKIHTDMCAIDFDQPVDVVYNFIRGLSPYPAAWTIIDGKTVKIIVCKKKYDDEVMPGEILTDQKSSLQVACQGGVIDILELKMEGKKRMKTSDFLNGYTIRSDRAGSS